MPIFYFHILYCECNFFICGMTKKLFARRKFLAIKKEFATKFSRSFDLNDDGRQLFRDESNKYVTRYQVMEMLCCHTAFSHKIASSLYSYSHLNFLCVSLYTSSRLSLFCTFNGRKILLCTLVTKKCASNFHAFRLLHYAHDGFIKEKKDGKIYYGFSE